MNRLFQIVCFIALTVFPSHKGYSQISEEAKRNFSKAEKFLQLGDYENALPLYLTILDSEPDNANINYRTGLCYINLRGKERESLPYLKIAVENIDDEYKPGNTNEAGASPQAWFLLGDAYHRDENLSEASKAYNKYKQYVANDKKELELVSERIIGLGVSRGEVRDHPRDVMLSNLGEKINTKSSEYNIIYSGDFKTMVFTRYEKRSDIVFYSAFENGGWTDPVEITEQIGSMGDMYATALSYDGKELYLILLTAYDADIYISEFKDGQWGYAENAGRNINSKYVESNACISADGKTLYFSSDRATSLGGFDIFRSEKVNGKWEKPESLGEVINTKANEESPFITNKSNTLYFSSDRPGSMGRMDVYFSRFENDTWVSPENLGMPYNTVDDDVAFKYYDKYRKSYIARDLPGGFGKLDLYMIQSGADRQRELMDNMPKIVSPEPVSEVVVTEAGAIVIAEISEELPEETEVVHESEETSQPESPEISIPEPPVKEVVAVAVVAEVVQKKEPEVVKQIEQVVVEEIVPEPLPEPELIKEVLKEPTIKKEREPEITQPQVQEGDYTVQILALIFPKRISNYRGLDPKQIRSVAGDDGYTRFVFGQYKTIGEATKALQIVFSKGYKDAYIRETIDISNFH